MMILIIITITIIIIITTSRDSKAPFSAYIAMGRTLDIHRGNNSSKKINHAK